MRGPAWMLASGVALSLARPASAQEGVRFEYSAPAGCPSQEEFVSRVRERVLGASAGSLPVERRGLVVRVAVEPALGRARVEFQEPDGARVERDVQGSDCDELVSGVALITALAFGSRTEQNPEASATTAEPTEARAQPEVAKPPNAEAPQKSQKPAPMAPPAKTRTVARGERSKTARTRSNVVEASATEAEQSEQAGSFGDDRVRPGPSLEAGAGGWVSSWLSPGRTLGADGFLRLGERAGGWSARLSLAYGSGATAEVDDRAADFSFLGGRLEGCPLGLAISGSARLEPCLAAELGRLRGAGREESALQVGQDQSVFWAAAVLVGRARATIANKVVVEAQAELGVPVTSHEFVFHDPETKVFSVPSLGGAGRIGIGVPFL